MSYGSIPSVERAARRQNGRSILAGGAALIFVAMVVISRTQTSPVELEAKKHQAWSYDWQGDSVPIPNTFVNYRAGTVDSVHGEFEHDARDKARPTQLSEMDKKGVWAYDYSGNSVPVPRTVVNFRAGTTDSASSEFENSAMDKARPTQLAAKAKQMFGLTAKDADAQLAAYFKSQAKAAASKQAPPKSLAYSAKTADEDLADYFAQQTEAAKRPQKQQQLRMTKSSAAHKAHPATKFGLSASKADADLAGYFHEQKVLSAKPRVTLKPVNKAASPLQDKKATKFGYSAKKADSDLASYFAAEQDRASKKQQPMKPAKEQAPPKDKAPKFGLSDSAALDDFNSYFAQQQKLAGEPVHKPREVECIGKLCTDKVVDAPIFSKDENSLEDTLVNADKADCTEDMDCESSRSPLIYKAKKIQKLSAYGVGAEDDNAIELGKAVGVDAAQPSSVMEMNEPPSEETIKEVNEAIDSQRGDRYTNGNGMPVEKVEAPQPK